MAMDRKEKKVWLTDWLVETVLTHPENALHNTMAEPCWDRPLIGFSRGDDPYYPFFKQDIGDFYWLPIETFRQGFPELNVVPEQLTVISWVLPHTRITREAHRGEVRFPSERWCRSRLYGEAFNNQLRGRMVEHLTAAGHPAVAPMLLPAFQREASTRYGYASSWSERHAAFVAGLGTFGLSDGLITPLGKSVRFGSVVAQIDIEADERPYQRHQAYCLFHRNGKCRRCAERCPVSAISETGHDKIKCSEYLRGEAYARIRSRYDLDIYACGLCQVGVPCESRIPTLVNPYPVGRHDSLIRAISW